MPPKARCTPYAITTHGDTRIDNYYWLRDDSRSRPEVLDYLHEENDYGRKVMSSQQALQDQLLNEMVQRIPPARYFRAMDQKWLSISPYLRTWQRVSHLPATSVLCAEWDEWDILLDATSAPPIASFIPSAACPSPPITPLWRWRRITSPVVSTVCVFATLETGNWYPEMLDNVSPDFVWANDSETVYYVKKHASTLLPYQVWRHTVGTDSADDELVYEEKDETFYVSLHKTSSRHYVIIFLASATTSEVLLLDAELPVAAAAVLPAAA